MDIYEKLKTLQIALNAATDDNELVYAKMVAKSCLHTGIEDDENNKVFIVTYKKKNRACRKVTDDVDPYSVNEHNINATAKHVVDTLRKHHYLAFK